MTSTSAPGLRADWLNAWLAAIGITVLLPSVRLSWTPAPVPHAVLHHDSDGDDDLIAAIAAALPDQTCINALVIARSHPHASATLGRHVDVGTYQERARLARANGDPTLAMCLTDLGPLRDGQADHAPLDPPAPRGTTLHDRLSKCRSHITDPPAAVRGTLTGTARRVQANGLGFDHTRLLTPSEPHGDTWIDPTIEVLAFAGMTLLPTRGDGRHAAQRGWTAPASKPGAFTWPTWPHPLTAAGIDALLDRYWSGARRLPEAPAFQTVPYQPRGSADTTRAYASQPLT